jgi:hypothetical protein
LKSRGAGPAGAQLDNIVLIPINTLLARVKDAERRNEAAKKVTALLRQRHHIQPPALDDFTVTNPAATVAQVTREQYSAEDIDWRFCAGSPHRRSRHHEPDVDLSV